MPAIYAAKRDYLERVVRGGYPEAVRRSLRRRAAFFDSYLTNLIERDVKELAVIERRGDLRRLLALLAGRSGGLLVPATLAAESGIPRTTLNRYLELLTAVFLIKQIPAWSASQTQRAIGTPKLAFLDTGIASHLLGQDAARLGESDGAAGAMIETFVLMELARQLTWCSERARLHHYRTKDRVEVDAILETPDGRVVAIEVKAGATVRAGDLAGLRHLTQRLGQRLVAGYVLYTGQQTLPFGDRLRALPIDAIWQTSPLPLYGLLQNEVARNDLGHITVRCPVILTWCILACSGRWRPGPGTAGKSRSASRRSVLCWQSSF
ncbi:MAG TPA: DUF4143 domain-containing protein [Streptosporangiaceae bacterium]